MKAKLNDRIVIGGHKVGSPLRRGLIVEVRGSKGAPPYMVRWDNEPGEHLLFPGTDAVIESASHS